MGVRTLTVYLLGDSSGLIRSLGRASVEIDNFSRKTTSVGDILGKITGTAGLALAAGFVAATAEAIKFDAAMHNVASISEKVQGSFAGTEQAVLNLSTAVPQSAVSLAKGLYEITSSGFDAANAMNVLQVSAKAASAGLSDTDTASRAITGALNAYGLSAASAQDVSDILFQTVKVGVVSFGDLAQQLGDFVGTAAAAKVPLQDVASAYAAITLSGIPAAEAATEVNQLLTHLLKPTQDLAGLYKQLGYESGASALQQKGLAAVIRDIGKATGGSAEAMVHLFGRVEPARAALALLAADGKNYQNAIDAITGASERAGATQRAFNEQMKSTAAQLQLFRNAAEAAAITLGLKVLPPLNAFLTAARQAGADALPYIEAALHRVAPLFQQVWSTVENLAKILADLGRAAAPFAQAFTAITAAIALPALKLFLGLLQDVTKFLADHTQVVEAVAAAYAATLIPSIAQATIMFNRFILTPVVLLLNNILIGAGNAGAALRGLATAAGLANLALTAGLGAAIYAVTRGFQQWNDAQDAAKQSTDEIRKSFNVYDTAKARQQLDALHKTAQHGVEVGKQYQGFLGTLKAGFSEVFGNGDVGKVAAEGEQAAEAWAALNHQSKNAEANLQAVSRATGETTLALGILAQKQHIDLSGTFNSSADARKRLIDYVHDLKHAQDVATASFVAGFGQDVEAAQAAAKAVDDFADTVQKSFLRDTDVLGNFDPSTSAKKVADAQESLAKARRASGSSGTASLRDEQRIARDRQAIQDAEEWASVSHTKSLSAQVSARQSIQRAQKRLADDQALIDARSSGGSSARAADAEAKLAQARREAANSELAASYKRAIQLGRDFTRDINAAVQRGLDPNVIGKLLQEGPAKAEPALQRILADHSGGLIKMVNQSEAEIGKLSDYVVLQARITAQAINSPDPFYINNRRKAMAIAAQEAATGGRTTAEAFAKSLHTSVANVREIARRFGITLADEVQSAVNRHPIQVNARGTIYVNEELRQGGALPGRGRSIARAEGGPVASGPFGRDAVIAGLTRGEWVQPKHAVDFYGQAFMEAIRTKSLPRFWDGGLVGADGALASSVLNIAGPRIVAVPVPMGNRSSYDNSLTYNIDRVVVGSLDQVPASTGGRTYSATRGVS